MTKFNSTIFTIVFERYLLNLLFVNKKKRLGFDKYLLINIAKLAALSEEYSISNMDFDDKNCLWAEEKTAKGFCEYVVWLTSNNLSNTSWLDNINLWSNKNTNRLVRYISRYSYNPSFLESLMKKLCESNIVLGDNAINFLLENYPPLIKYLPSNKQTNHYCWASLAIDSSHIQYIKLPTIEMLYFSLSAGHNFDLLQNYTDIGLTEDLYIELYYYAFKRNSYNFCYISPKITGKTFEKLCWYYLEHCYDYSTFARAVSYTKRKISKDEYTKMCIYIIENLLEVSFIEYFDNDIITEEFYFTIFKNKKLTNSIKLNLHYFSNKKALTTKFLKMYYKQYPLLVFLADPKNVTNDIFMNLDIDKTLERPLKSFRYLSDKFLKKKIDQHNFFSVNYNIIKFVSHDDLFDKKIIPDYVLELCVSKNGLLLESIPLHRCSKVICLKALKQNKLAWDVIALHDSLLAKSMRLTFVDLIVEKTISL